MVLLLDAQAGGASGVGKGFQATVIAITASIEHGTFDAELARLFG